MRFQNRSFGPLDWAKQDERIEPEKESGSDYREVVQLFIQSLKDCVGTPENPGEMYVQMHFPGEPIDVSIPYDAAARLAYDEWRGEQFQESEFQQFKEIYEKKSVAEVVASRYARELAGMQES